VEKSRVAYKIFSIVLLPQLLQDCRRLNLLSKQQMFSILGLQNACFVQNVFLLIGKCLTNTGNGFLQTTDNWWPIGPTGGLSLVVMMESLWNTYLSIIKTYKHTHFSLHGNVGGWMWCPELNRAWRVAENVERKEEKYKSLWHWEATQSINPVT
jgi:hypothetical protein